MKLLTKELLTEYGFEENELKSINALEVFSKDKVDIIIKDGQFYYSNMGFDYPLKDLAALKKVYKELRREDLKLKC
jgi:hypothetical protein